jgi:hypothetical protein
VAEARDRFAEARTAAGREPDAVDRYQPGFLAGLLAEQSGRIHGRAAALRFTDVLAHWPRASSWYAGSEKVLESVAAMLPRLRGR